MYPRIYWSLRVSDLEDCDKHADGDRKHRALCNGLNKQSVAKIGLGDEIDHNEILCGFRKSPRDRMAKNVLQQASGFGGDGSIARLACLTARHQPGLYTLPALRDGVEFVAR